MGQRPKSPSLTAKRAPGLRKPTPHMDAPPSVLDSFGAVDGEDCIDNGDTFADSGGEANGRHPSTRAVEAVSRILTRAEVEANVAARVWSKLPDVIDAVANKAARTGDSRAAEVILRASGHRAHEEDSAISSWESALRPCYRGMEAQLLAGAVDLPALAGEVGP